MCEWVQASGFLGRGLQAFRDSISTSLRTGRYGPVFDDPWRPSGSVRPRPAPFCGRLSSLQPGVMFSALPRVPKDAGGTRRYGTCQP